MTVVGVVQAEAVQDLRQEWLTKIPAGRLAEVADMQAAVVFMASDASSYMVGANMVIDGGYSIW